VKTSKKVQATMVIFILQSFEIEWWEWKYFHLQHSERESVEVMILLD